jgi:hypothetical protein
MLKDMKRCYTNVHIFKYFLTIKETAYSVKTE